MGAYTFLNGFFPEDLVERARQAGYSDDNILILQDNEDSLKEYYPDTYDNILSCIYNRDSRSPMEYARDLVASWLFEDFVLDEINASGMHAKLNGADRQRKVLPVSKVSSNSDIVVSYDGKKKQLELMNDYTGYWQKNGKIDLRDDKYRKLVQTASLFLGISLATPGTQHNYILLEFSKEISANPISSHRAYGGKPAYSIQVARDLLIPFTFQDFDHIVAAIQATF